MNGLFKRTTITLMMMMACVEARSQTVVTISDFQAINPLIFPFGGSTWAIPVNQFEFFTEGLTSGQQVVPLVSGSPTVSGGAGASGLSLNLTGANGLQLTARLLPTNEALNLQVVLLDTDGTAVSYNFSASEFNTSTFSSVNATFASGTIIVAGLTPGLSLDDIAIFEVQGNSYDLDGAANALFNVQFSRLSALEIPEPAGWGMELGAGIVLFAIFHRRRTLSAQSPELRHIHQRHPLI